MKRIIGLLICAAVAGCDSKPSSSSAAPSPAPSGDSKKEPAKGGSKNDPKASPDPEISVSGKVKFDGTAPKRRPVSGLQVEAMCAAMYPEDKPLLKEDLIVGADGAICNAIVWVSGGLDGRTFEAPKEQVKVIQKGCCYVPHVFGIVAGQTVLVVNSDGVLHNVHFLPKINGLSPDNAGQKPGQENTWVIPSPEEPFKIKCDIHPWMATFCLVSPHPYFVVTGDDGSFDLKNLPPGEYEIQTWTESLGTQTQKVTVGGDKKKAKIDFTFKK